MFHAVKVQCHLTVIRSFAVAIVAGYVGTLVGNRTGARGLRERTAPAISVAGPTPRRGR